MFANEAESRLRRLRKTLFVTLREKNASEIVFEDSFFQYLLIKCYIFLLIETINSVLGTKI